MLINKAASLHAKKNRERKKNSINLDLSNFLRIVPQAALMGKKRNNTLIDMT
jgi:hypothetical protein